MIFFIFRVIRVNDDPQSVEFCNQKGDILVGLGKNVHIIRHTNYLPQVRIYQMFCMQFHTQRSEPAIPFTEDLMKLLKSKTAQKIRNTKSSYLT